MELGLDSGFEPAVLLPCFFEKIQSKLRPIEKGCGSMPVVTRSPATKIVSCAKPGYFSSSKHEKICTACPG